MKGASMESNHNRNRPELRSKYRTELITVPNVIRKAPGIIINSRRYKSFVYTTDVATIMYQDGDAVMAVYPYTPHPSIMEALRLVSPVPVLTGVGGSITQGERSADLARFADAYGSVGVVLNAAVDIDTIKAVYKAIDIPIVYTVISEYMNLDEYLEAGVSIINVSGGKNTARIVDKFHRMYPDLPIIATGGKKDEYILETIEAGAHAISYTPPTTQEVFHRNMDKYRKELKEDYLED